MCNRVAPVVVVLCVVTSNPFFVPQVMHICNPVSVMLTYFRKRLKLFNKQTNKKKKAKCVMDVGVRAMHMKQTFDTFRRNRVD